VFSIEYVLYKIIFDALTGKQIQEVLNACQGWGGLHTHIQIHIHEHTRIHAHTHTQVHTYIRTGIRTIAELFFLLYNNDVGQESAQKFMKQTGDLKAATLYFAS